MPKGLIYNVNTGEIKMALYTASATFESVDSTPDPDFEIMVGEGRDDRNYIDISVDPVVVKTKGDLSADFDKTTITANGSDAATLSTLPDPCTVYVNEVANVIEGGSFAFTASTAGSYAIRVMEVVTKRKDWVITAN